MRKNVVVRKKKMLRGLSDGDSHYFCILKNLFQLFLSEKQKSLKIIKMHRFLTFFFFINFKSALYKVENEYKIIQQKIKMGQNYGLIKV